MKKIHIMLKEEPEQETAEQAANRLLYTVGNEGISSVHSFIEGVKYQAERSYSREEVVEIIYKYIKDNNQGCIFESDEKWIKENLK